MKTMTKRLETPMTKLAAVLLIMAAAACGPSARNNGDDDDDGSTGSCTSGQLHCNGNELQTCVDGSFQDSMACPMACSETIGCAICVPGSATCTGDLAHTCNDDGSGYYDETCDALEGETCDPNGGCQGACAAHTLGQSYIGCEYYPTVMGNIVSNDFDYAIAISNAGGTPANITIDGGGLASAITVQVPASSVALQILPWIDSLKLCVGTEFGCTDTSFTEPGIVPGGAYHVRSDQPITLYQFSPLEYELPSGEASYTNDASLMLPTNVWRNDFYVASWPDFPFSDGAYPSEVEVVASQDGTMVTIASRATTQSSGTVPVISPGTPQTVTMNKGDIMEILSSSGDLTGSEITSTAPIQVIGGNACTNIPTDIQYCDHIEESMFAVETLGTRYLVNAPAVTSIPSGKVEIVRVIATAPNTTLTYDPPQPGAPTTIANAGDFVEIDNNDQSFLVTASDKVLVAQYMEGQNAGGDTGDPAMTLAVPVEQFRTSYSFHAPISYESNYVDVTAPTGATVTLDGNAVPLTPVGTTGFQLGRVQALSTGPAGDGNHTISGSMPFGISVYGYGQYTSYWYPGGLNLTTVIE